MNAHPAAELFPLMTGEEFQGLVESIRESGLSHPIVTLDGQILDGRHRHRACAEAGVEPRYVEAALNGSGPYEYVVIENLQHRHLTPSQRAAVAAKAMDLLAAEAKQRQRDAGRLHGRGRPASKVEPDSAQPIGRSRQIAAKKFGVGHSQIGSAIALKKRAPAVFAKVEAGELTINGALKKAGLNASGATTVTQRPRDKHKPVIEAAKHLANLDGKWDRAMTDALTPPQARKQLTVLRKAATLLAEVIEAVEYRADTLATFRR